MRDRNILLIVALLIMPCISPAADRKCVKWFDIGVGEEPRSVVVKPTYSFEMFARSLAVLPQYHPEIQVQGPLRMWGSDYVGAGLAQRWQRDIARSQPGLRMELNMVNALIAMPSVALDLADLAPSRAASWAELFMFERVHNYAPLEIPIATGAWSSSFSIFVHKDNPISQLTMEQLDGIFGAQRTGTYKGTQWTTEDARGSEKNIRKWGQLGLTGKWKDQPIRVYGSILNGYLNRHFERLVFKGGVKWNEDFREYETCMDADGKKYYRQDQIADEMAKDPYSIGFGYQQFSTRPMMKALKLGANASGPFVELTIENLHNQTYPLAQSYYVYVNRKPGTAVDPKIKEFLRYVLSREGQTAIAKHGKYLPLTPERAKAALALIE